jgi:hypothetical protein
MWLLPLLAVLLGYALYKMGTTIATIGRYYRAARKTGLPIVVSPVTPRNPVWLLTQKYLAPIICQAPFGIGSWARFTKRGWLWKDHEKMHQELGKVWVQVSPRGLDVSESPMLFRVRILGSLFEMEKARACVEVGKSG